MYQYLKEWKLSTRRKPLILNGARQVGKTYALQHFGKACFENVVYLNFEQDEKLPGYFNGSLDPKRLLETIEIHTESTIDPQKTLLIFDEIQECPRALNSLKYFCEEAREYHIAAAGSLLGVKTSQEKGFPVGKVNFLHLYPLTFFEFLSAIEHDKLRSHLENIDDCSPIPEPLHAKLIELLKLYLFIGGMPEVVSEYAENRKLEDVRETQLEILEAYEKDFAKHAPPNEIMKITTLWTQVHRQLAKENKKFIFAAIRKSARGRDFEYAMQWLLDAGLIHKSCFVPTPKFPLSAYANSNIFKIFLLDIGLLGAQSNLNPKLIIDGNKLFTEFKGALVENFVAQELASKSRRNLYYWASEGSAEVDFLLEGEHEIYPLEVKSGETSRKKSLLIYGKKYSPEFLSRTTPMNLKKDGNICNYPLYLISRFLQI